VHELHRTAGTSCAYLTTACVVCFLHWTAGTSCIPYVGPRILLNVQGEHFASSFVVTRTLPPCFFRQNFSGSAGICVAADSTAYATQPWRLTTLCTTLAFSSRLWWTAAASQMPLQRRAVCVQLLCLTMKKWAATRLRSEARFQYDKQDYVERNHAGSSSARFDIRHPHCCHSWWLISSCPPALCLSVEVKIGVTFKQLYPKRCTSCHWIWIINHVSTLWLAGSCPAEDLVSGCDQRRFEFWLHHRVLVVQ
jgi:hypothetical protein